MTENQPGGEHRERKGQEARYEVDKMDNLNSIGLAGQERELDLISIAIHAGKGMA